MSSQSFLKRTRESFLDRSADAEDWQARFYSAATYSLARVCRATLATHCHGLVLDAGSGRGTWRSTIMKTASGYESIDMAPRGSASPTWVGDVCCMPQVPAGRYDAVICHQVLEHVRQPWRAAAEFFRVLKPGGNVIVSVPHLSRRHELPHDYFRFTQEGLAALLEDAGFEVSSVLTHGGVVSFLHHQVSFLFPGLLLPVPLLGQAAALVNAPFSWLFTMLDAAIDRRALLALGVLATARKPLPEAQ
jgi:SAM-dependent methyltransferase